MRTCGQNGSLRSSSPKYWMIADSENRQMSMLTIERNGKRMMPVFCFGEEAEMFLRGGAFGSRWSLRETTAGELLSVLYGPCRDVEWIVLDPLPEALASEEPGCSWLRRGRFAAFVMNREKSARPGENRGPARNGDVSSTRLGAGIRVLGDGRPAQSSRTASGPSDIPSRIAES